MPMRTGPCDWPLAHCGEEGGGAEACSSLASLTVEMRALIEGMATEYLWHWTGRQFGTCPVVTRPCRETCGDPWTTYRGRSWGGMYLPYYESGGSGYLQPGLINGQWFNFGCGGECNNDPCACSSVPTITLAGPVATITEVRVDGVVLASTAYRLDNHRYLLRIDGGTWPTCQDMTADPLTDDNTFQVTYDLGIPVPAGGQVAAGILACQMAKAACNDKSCQLPQRLQSITRQGVTMTILDSYGSLYEHGTTGLFLVDSWVASIMGSNRKSGLRVASPDVRPTRRAT